MTEIYAFRAENWVENQRNIAELFQKETPGVCLPQCSEEAQVRVLSRPASLFWGRKSNGVTWAQATALSPKLEWGQGDRRGSTFSNEKCGDFMLLTVWLQDVNSQSRDWEWLGAAQRELREMLSMLLELWLQTNHIKWDDYLVSSRSMWWQFGTVTSPICQQAPIIRKEETGRPTLHSPGQQSAHGAGREAVSHGTVSSYSFRWANGLSRVWRHMVFIWHSTEVHWGRSGSVGGVCCSLALSTKRRLCSMFADGSLDAPPAAGGFKT